MALLINIGLVVVAFVSALAALGGKTWREDDSLKWQRRITRRGWFAICCMVATLMLGAVKHVRDHRAASSANEAQSRTAQALDTQVALYRMLATLLDTTNRELATTRTQVVEANALARGQTEQQRRTEERRQADEAARRAAEEAAFAPARKNIYWAVKEGGRGTYLAARAHGRSPYEAALLAQMHNPSVLETIRALGAVRTDEYIRQIGE